MPHLQQVREQMVQQQVRAWDVLDPQALAALSAVPREWFVPAAYQSVAFVDAEIPLAAGQRMLAPKLAGRILQAAAPGSGERVLEVGTGSGYLSACFARLGCEVKSLEIEPTLVEFARGNLSRLRSIRCEVVLADAFAPGILGGPWDVIVLTGSLPVYDARFERALAPGGRLFAVVGNGPVMNARLIRPTGSESLFETSLAPLKNAPTAARFSF
jgi:protein-L-isoaspartate(D-aspartate) O-methyltransferase